MLQTMHLSWNVLNLVEFSIIKSLDTNLGHLLPKVILMLLSTPFQLVLDYNSTHNIFLMEELYLQLAVLILLQISIVMMSIFKYGEIFGLISLQHSRFSLLEQLLTILILQFIQHYKQESHRTVMLHLHQMMAIYQYLFIHSGQLIGKQEIKLLLPLLTYK